MMTPAKFKKLLIGLLKALVVIELVSAFSEGIREKQWARFGIDLVVAGVLYVMWDRITTLVREKKEEYRRRMSLAPHDIGIWDALIFSLLWSDEIYMDIPADRRRLVVNSYTLIALGLAAAFIGIGSGLMPLVISGALVLAAVNLLVWVVSLERGEKESLQTELRLAHGVQTSLMPKDHPVIPGFDIAGLSLPAREVGGDHFDYACLGSDHEAFGICVFDVSGKGMEAAMSAVFTSGAFASEAKRSTSVGDILTRLNGAVFTHSKRGRFVAFLLAMIDVRRRVLTFSNAGQMKPLGKMSGQTRWLNSTGVSFPLGMQPDSRYEEQQVQLIPGDLLFLLTDGFTEAMNEQRELYGDERLEQLVRNLDADRLSAQEILDRITREVRLYVASAPQHDDMTMVVVKVL
jgi:serine phosphatase RsbU (regulator of sigma subunit)